VWRRVFWRPVRHLADWHVNTQIGSRRNALIASTAFAERRKERDEIEAFLSRHRRPRETHPKTPAGDVPASM
jgi:N-dimethylarginine dimethylaminohydrolase